MIKIGLIGHEYRYEAFQIASLFYEKNEITFVEENDAEYLSIFDEDNKKCIFKAKESSEGLFEESIDLDKKSIKNGIKASMLNFLKKKTKREVPWGILVGIRPTKLYHEFLESGLSEDEIRKIFREKYYLSEDKIELVTEIGKAESKFLGFEKNKIGIYIGIPFCPTRCVYCSFTSNPIGKNNKLVDEYINGLLEEIEYTFKELKNKNIEVDTLYIGGGTPTSINSKQLEKLLKTVADNCDLKSLREYTVEAGRPDSIDEEKLRLIKKYGATRISINPQTMNDETLRRIGRLHTSEDVRNKFNLARKIGFDNINMDMIIGLPNEEESHVEKTLDEVLQLNPESITVHTMAIKRASTLNEENYLNKNENIVNMYNIASAAIREGGLKPYYMYRQKNMISPLENIGYSYNGNECIYNVQMIAENISIIGLGAGSVSKAVYPEENRIERISNLKDVREYNNRLSEIIDKKREIISLIDLSFK